MKTTFLVAVSLLSSGVLAEPPKLPGPTGPDRMLILRADQMPLPPPNADLLKMHSATMTKAEDGFSTVDQAPDRVRQFMNDLEVVKTQPSTAREAEGFAEAAKRGTGVSMAPMVVQNLKDLKLGFGVATMRSGRLIGAAPQGTIVRGGWTGVERYFKIDGAGYSRLSETDMSLTGGMFYMNKGAINTTMGGKPAISKVFVDHHGQRVEEVLWVDRGKLYMLTFAPDLQVGRYGKQKANTSVSAFSLASEVR